MQTKRYLLFIIFTIILTACTSNSSLNPSEKMQLVEQVKIVEENEFDLLYFNKPYDEYFKAVNEFVSDQFWVSKREEIIFGYDGETYTREDLANMSQEEYDKHKEHMLQIIRQLGMDHIRSTIRISEVHKGEQSNQFNIYTVEHKELEQQPFTVTTKKYTLEKLDGKWLITNAAQDKFTYGSDQTAEKANEGIKEIGYPTVFVLSGVGK